jgi:hypothetical protein
MPRAAFVLMPFAPEFRPGYDDLIRPAVGAAGLECVRADQEALGHIHQMMFERILESPVVIADISGCNPNVFYELGVAHSTARKAITVVREDWRERIPFDIAPYRVIVYPQRPEGSATDQVLNDYRDSLRRAVEALTASISAVIDFATEGISNPVQDYLSTRSPLTCGESRYVDSLSDSDEEAMIRHATDEVIAVGITGSHFGSILAHVIEAGERSEPLSVRVVSLDPQDRDGWRYVYHLREGRAVTDEEFDDLFTEDRMMLDRVGRNLRRLNQRDGFNGEITYYSGVPVFWAYRIDNERIFVGNHAMHRLSSRLPVSVLVRDDPRTRTVYRYYDSIIKALAIAAPRADETSRKPAA